MGYQLAGPLAQSIQIIDKSFLALLITAALALFFGTVLEGTKQFAMRKWFGPEIGLLFNVSYGSLVNISWQQRSRKDPNVHRTKVVRYYRIIVRSSKLRHASKCQGFLTGFRKWDEDGQQMPVNYCDSIPLHWSYLKSDREQSLDIMRGVPQFLDVFTWQNSKDFQPLVLPRTVTMPVIYKRWFRGCGRYEFSVTVTAEGADPQPITISLNCPRHGEPTVEVVLPR